MSPALCFGQPRDSHALYALSFFRFGGLTKMYGQSMNRLLKYLLVPVYMVAMAPVAIIVTIWT